MKNLLNKLALNGGKIVSSAKLHQLEIAEAGANNDIYVDDNGFGFVYIHPATSVYKDAIATCIIKKFSGSKDYMSGVNDTTHAILNKLREGDPLICSI